MFDTLKEAVAEYATADRALAELSLREIKAGVHDETPEFDVANDRVLDAERALPWSAFFFVELLVSRRNRDVWEQVWAVEDRLDAEASLRSRLIDALEAEWLKGAAGKVADSPRGHCTRLADAVLALLNGSGS